MNTVINYMYRDGADWKNIQCAVLSGVLSDEQKQAIKDACDSGEYFIPRQVGLPEERFSEITEDDHCWFEFLSLEDTDKPVTELISAKEMYENFVSVKGNWNETAWLDDLSEEEKEIVGVMPFEKE